MSRIGVGLYIAATSLFNVAKTITKKNKNKNKEPQWNKSTIVISIHDWLITIELIK